MKRILLAVFATTVCWFGCRVGGRFAAATRPLANDVSDSSLQLDRNLCRFERRLRMGKPGST